MYMTYKITLCSSSIFAMATLILNSITYLLYMTCKIFLISIYIFTPVTKKTFKQF